MVKSDSFGAPFSRGVASDAEQYLAQYSEGFRSSLPGIHSALGTSVLSMSDYGKSQQYVYGKWHVAHLMFSCGSCHTFGRMDPFGCHVRVISMVY